MPTVPRLQRQVQPQATTNIRQSNVSPGNAQVDTRGQQALGNAAVGLAKTAMDIEQKELQKADELAFLKADQAASEYETKFLYDRENGAMNQQGEDAFGLPDRVKSDYDKKMQEIRDGLANDRQKNAFEKSYMSRRKAVNKQLYSHMSNEGRKFDGALTESYIANEQNAALKNFHDPERIDMAMQRTRAALLQHGDRNGLPAEYTKMKIQDAESKTYAGVISKILDGGDDMAAKEYFKTYKDKLTGDDEQRVSKLIEAGALRGESQRTTDNITDKHSTIGDALDEARKISDPKLRDEVISRVKTRFAENKQIADANQNAIFETAFKMASEAKSLDAIPTSTLDQLDSGNRVALEKRVRQLAEGREPVTDWFKYYDLEQMAASPKTQSQFVDMNLSQVRYKMADSEFKKLSSLQASLRKQDPDGEAAVDSIRTKTQIVDQSLRSAGVLPPSGSLDEKQRKSQADFGKELDYAVEARSRIEGRKLKNSEIQEEVDSLLIKMIKTPQSELFGIPIPFTGESDYLFSVNQEQRKGLPSFGTIPKSDVAQIRNMLRNENLPDTPAQITKRYLLLKRLRESQANAN